jgi:hypothetical protein
MVQVNVPKFAMDCCASAALVETAKIAAVIPSPKYLMTILLK